MTIMSEWDNCYISNYKLYFKGLYLQVRKPFIGLGPGLIRSVFFAMPQNRKKPKKTDKLCWKKTVARNCEEESGLRQDGSFLFQPSGKKEGGAVAEGSSDSEIK